MSRTRIWRGVCFINQGPQCLQRLSEELALPADARSGGAGVAKKTPKTTGSKKSKKAVAVRTTASPATKSKRSRPPAKSAFDPAKTPGVARTAAAYASLGLAKGLRVAASTIGLIRGRKKS